MIIQMISENFRSIFKERLTFAEINYPSIFCMGRNFFINEMNFTQVKTFLLPAIQKLRSLPAVQSFGFDKRVYNFIP